LYRHGAGESVRPVAAQQFNVLQLGGEYLYYGERWQSTPSGLKADDFSYRIWPISDKLPDL
jgi:hypothetical protein